MDSKNVDVLAMNVHVGQTSQQNVFSMRTIQRHGTGRSVTIASACVCILRLLKTRISWGSHIFLQILKHIHICAHGHTHTQFTSFSLFKYMILVRFDTLLGPEGVKNFYGSLCSSSTRVAWPYLSCA